MLLSGTVLQDSTTVIEDGAVVVEGAEIVAVGDRASLADQYPDHRTKRYGVVMPGLVGSHIHSVQSLGRGLSDDQELLDWLFDAVLPMEASLTADEMEVAARLGYLELIETGTTTVVDHLSVNHAHRAFQAAGDMGIRGLLGKVLMDQHAPDGLLEETQVGLDRTETLIEDYHRSFDDRIRYAVTPRFAVSCSEACLRGARELADEHDGVRIHTHASETRDEIETIEDDTGKRNIHWLDEVGLTGEDVVLAHCVWTDESERELLAETGTNVTHCPTSNMKLASGIAPIVDYLDRGINVALGNDGPPCNNTLDPFTEMKQASTLQKVDRLDPTVTPVQTIFEMATVNGAKAAGFDRLGELKPGWRADIVGLSADGTRATPLYDVLSYIVFAARGDDVEFTMVDGEVLMEDGEVKSADADGIRRSANEVAESLDLSHPRMRSEGDGPTSDR
ncbi:5'-deoxyadenosine deaminase [Haloarcula halophila]|uniref:5'-deoxyadenosine deaminase n=1 Tax=Haloarcula TaxID=2237 RepID=UPI0023E46882|nr:5'-deoxyadenosine deaminase [Halomicroarcula sp. DFY41]